MRPGTRYALGLGLLLVGAPLPVDAAGPTRPGLPVLGSFRETRAQVGQATVAARLDEAQGRVRLHLTATSPSARPEALEVKVDVYAPAPSNPMARMVLPPRLLSTHVVSLALRSGRATAEVVVPAPGLDAAARARLYPVLRPAGPGAVALRSGR